MRDLQVILHLHADMKGIEAWRIFGIPQSSFYYIMEKNPEAITEM